MDVLIFLKLPILRFIGFFDAIPLVKADMIQYHQNENEDERRSSFEENGGYYVR